MHGHLQLTCSRDASGRTCLSHQSFAAPFHISKPYWDGQALTVQIINPTAGIFSGDRLQCDVKVEAGARLNLTTPSATRIYTMPEGSAESMQNFSVARDARLCLVPSLLVPQRKSCFHQTTRFTVEPGGELLAIEMVAPGRVAHNECFEFTELRYELELFWGEKLNARECFRLRPDDASLKPLRSLFPQGCWASCYLLANQLTDDHPALSSIRDLHCPESFVGLSRLPFAGWSLKILAQDNCVLHRTLLSLQRILSQTFDFAFALPASRPSIRTARCLPHFLPQAAKTGILAR